MTIHHSRPDPFAPLRIAPVQLIAGCQLSVIEAGITGVKGREGSWVKNDKGVSLHLTSKSEGLALSIGVEGLKISK